AKLIVDLFPVVDEAKLRGKGTLPLDSVVVGHFERPGQFDTFRFECNAGQEVGIQAVTAAIDSKTEPVLKWLGPTGAAVAESRSGWLAVVCPEAGAYSLTIHDREFRGGKDYSYRLQVGTVPIVSSVFPLGLKRGTEREFHLT